MKKVFAPLSPLVLVSLLLTACGVPPTPSAPMMETVAVTAVVTEAPTAAPQPTVAPTPVASVDPSALASQGKLLVCWTYPIRRLSSSTPMGTPQAPMWTWPPRLAIAWAFKPRS